MLCASYELITNRSCSMPLHVVLTDTILCYCGSLELVRIMNRVGAAAFIDTASRLATSVYAHESVEVSDKKYQTPYLWSPLTILWYMPWSVALIQVKVGMGYQHSVYNPYQNRSYLMKQANMVGRHPCNHQ